MRTVLAAVVLVVVCTASACGASGEVDPLAMRATFPGSNHGLTTRSCQDLFTPTAITKREGGDSASTITATLTYTGTAPCPVSRYGPTINLVGPDGTEMDRMYNTDLVLITPDTTPVRHGDTEKFSVVVSLQCSGARRGDYWMRTYLGLTAAISAKDPGLILPLGSLTPSSCSTATPPFQTDVMFSSPVIGAT